MNTDKNEIWLNRYSFYNKKRSIKILVKHLYKELVNNGYKKDEIVSFSNELLKELLDDLQKRKLEKVNE